MALRNPADWNMFIKESKQMNTVELLNGVKEYQISEASNQIYTNKYTFENFIPKVLLSFFTRVLHLYLLLITILMFVFQQHNPYWTWISLFPLVITLIFKLIKEFFLNMRNKHDNKINNVNVMIATQKGMQESTWSQIRVGDVIYLHQGDIVPADIVLLDSNQTKDKSSYVYLQIYRINGMLRRTYKKALNGTRIDSRGLQKNNWDQYKSVLSGKFQFPSQNKEEFTGYMKLNKDPKPQLIQQKNFIPRGSIILTAGWIFGMAVYVGRQTRIFTNNLPNYSKKNYLDYFSSYFSIILIIVQLILGLISYLLSHNSLFQTFKRQTSQGYLYLTYVFLYSPIVHYYKQFCEEVINLYRSISLQFINQNLHIVNNKLVEEIAHIDVFVMDKSGTLCTGKEEVAQIRNSNGCYIVANTQIDHKENDALIEEIERPDTSAKKLIRRKTKEKKRKKQNMLIGNKKKYFYQQFNKGKDQIYKLLQNFCICNTAQLNYVFDWEQFVGLSISKTQQSIIEFCRKLNWKLQRTNQQQKVFLKVNNQIRKFVILGINDENMYRKRLSYVYKNQISQNVSYVICKGRPQDMYFYLHLKDFQKYQLRLMIQKFQKRGNKCIIYGLKRLSLQETNQYQTNYQREKNSLLPDQKKLADLGNNIQQKLQFLSLVATKDQIVPGAETFIKMIQKNNKRLIILTGDQEQQAKTLYNNVKTQQLPNQYQIFFVQKQKLKQQMGHALQQYLLSIQSIDTKLKRGGTVGIFEQYQNTKKQKLCIILNGLSFSQIIKDVKLLEKFKILLFFSNTVVGYNFKGVNKAIFVQILKQILPDDRICTIGDGYNDSLMHSCSHVAVKIQQKNIIVTTSIKKQITQNNGADIIANDFNTLTQLIQHSINIRHQNLRILIYLFDMSIRMIFVLFFIDILLFRQTEIIINRGLIFCYFTVMFMPSIFAHLASEDLMSVIIHKMQLYQISVQKKKTSLLRLTVQGVILPILQAIYITLIYYFTIPYMVNPPHPLPSQTLFLILFLIVYFVQLLNFFQFTISSLVGTALDIIILIVVIIVYQFVEFGEEKIWFYLKVGGGSWGVWGLVVMGIGGSLLIRKIGQIILRYIDSIQRLMHIIFQNLQNRQMIDNQIDKVLKKQSYRGVADIFVGQIQDFQVKEIVTKLIDAYKEFNMNIVFLNILDRISQNLFYNENRKECKKIFQNTLIFLIIVFTIQTVVERYLWLDQEQLVQFIIFRVPIIFVGIILLLIFQIKSIQTNYYRAIRVLQVLATITIILVEWFYTDSIFSDITIMILYIEILNQTHAFQIIQTLILSLLINISLIIHLVVKMKSQLFQDVILIAIIFAELYLSALAFLGNYRLIKLKKRQFRMKKDVSNKEKQIKQILGILVPSFVEDSLKSGKFLMQQPQDQVTILFCYLNKTDDIIQSQGRSVVVLLDELFRMFDKICTQHGVQKIQTVGFSYLAATGLKACERQLSLKLLKHDPTERLVKMAADMMDKVENSYYGANKDKPISMQIGIHKGRVIAGVIGFHKPQFSLIGDTINTSSRVASNALPDTITLSQQAYRKVKGKFDFMKREVVMKGLGQKSVYQLVQKKIMTKNPKLQKAWAVLRNQAHNIIFRYRIQKIRVRIKHLLMNPIQIRMLQQKQQLYIMAQQLKKNTNQVKQLKQLKKQQDIYDKDQVNFNQFFQPQCANQNGLQQFKIYVNKYNMTTQLIISIGMIVIYTIITIIESFNYQKEEKKIYLGFKISALMLLAIQLVLHKVDFQMIPTRILSTVIFIYAVVVCPILLSTFQIQYQQLFISQVLNSSIVVTAAGSLSYFSVIQMLIISSAYIISWLVSLVIYKLKYSVVYIFIFFTIVNTVFQLRKMFLHITLKMREFNQYYTNQSKLSEHNGIVSQLLPKHAFNKLKNYEVIDKHQLTNQFENTTMLFADIKGYTAYSNKVQPEAVVQMLRQLYTNFDRSCVKNHVYKMYTIGDCYVVLGFLDAMKRNPPEQALNVLNQAFDMLRDIQRVRVKIQYDGLLMRIGIHSGSIIDGVIGTDVVRYDFYGPDVKLANKFQQNGIPGNVLISQSTMKLLQTNPKFVGYKIVQYENSVPYRNQLYKAFFIEEDDDKVFK